MRMFIFLCSLFVSQCACESGSHSLWMMVTYIRGKTPFPEFSLYLTLDDIVFGHYDSHEAKVVHIDSHKQSDTMIDAEDLNYIGSYLGYVHGQMKERASDLKNHFNHTNDIHVFQRAAGCELLENDKPGPMVNKDAYNGEVVEVEYYDVDHDTLHTDRKLPNMDSYIWTHFSPLRYGMIFHPNCIKYLRKHLAKERKRVLKKVKPRVKLLQKTLPNSGGTTVTCLATGFYPRHINLTLLRDGQPVPDHQITGGELLPNADETYQMRKSLEVSAEELQQHHYTCTAEHLSLDNKLDANLERGWDSASTSIVSSVLVAVFVCLFGAVVVFIMCRRKHKGGGSQWSDYSAASTSEEMEKIEGITS